jgi:SEC-C motif-containing protein
VAKEKDACPCRSGKKYKACCGPLHAGAREAETPEALMRSRFSAFARGLGAYLVKTLAAAHPDRALPEAALARELGSAKERQRFLDLCILHTSAESDAGEVLFYARIFERGGDRSFAELSSFTREAGAWRYASGVLVPGAMLPADPTSLDRAGFLALADHAAR